MGQQDHVNCFPGNCTVLGPSFPIQAVYAARRINHEKTRVRTPGFQLHLHFLE